MGLTDEQWEVLAPLIEACRPAAKVPPRHLRRTISAIIWRHDNGAKWRSLPEALGPWWMAAQTFIRWSRLGVWERLLSLVQERGISLGMTFLDGTSIRAHQKAAGALSGISCVSGHDGSKGAPTCRDAKSRRSPTPCSISCWPAPIRRRPSIQTAFSKS